MRDGAFYICLLLAFVLFYGEPSLHSQLVKHYATCPGK